MHDTDRILTEHGSAYESNGFEMSDGFEMETYGEGVFNEVDETELASQFMEITDEQELEQFLGSLVKKIGGLVKSPIGQSVVGHLKNAAKQYLPKVQQAVQKRFGGTAGNIFGSVASGLGFESEEGEDEQYEMARNFVRFAGTAVKKASRLRGGSPSQVKNILMDAARQFLPDLLGGRESEAAGIAAGPKAGGGANTGRWIRKGNKIMLIGV